MDHLDPPYDAYLATVIVTWDDRGLPLALSGPHVDLLPARRLHVVTAWNLNGETAAPAVNREAHFRLVADLERAGAAWRPAIGAARDGSHHELGIVSQDLTRRRAVALGVRHDQLAVFELTDEDLVVVPCDGGPVRSTRRWGRGGEVSLTYDQLTAWRTEHEEVIGARLARTRCPFCGAPDPARIAYGLPSSWPPDWVALGGCVMGGESPRLRCRSCGHAW